MQTFSVHKRTRNEIEKSAPRELKTPLVIPKSQVTNLATSGYWTHTGLPARVHTGDAINEAESALPVLEFFKARIVLMAAGPEACCVVTERDGQPGHNVFTWGPNNDYGVLGRDSISFDSLDRDVDTSRTPKIVEFSEPELYFVDLDVGKHHMVILSSTGDFYVWGSILDHLARLYVPLELTVPFKYPFLSGHKVKRVRALTSAVLVHVDTDDSVWTIGLLPGESATYDGFRDDFTTNDLCAENFGARHVMDNVFSLFGGYGSVFLTQRGGLDLFSLGVNSFGQLGQRVISFPGYANKGGNFEVSFEPRQVKTLGQVKNIECGPNHSVALVEIHGKTMVMSCGDNLAGQQGNSDPNMGSNGFVETDSVSKLVHNGGSVVSIGVGDRCSFVTFDNGFVYGFGNNLYHNLALRDFNDQKAPVLLNNKRDVREQPFMYGRRVIRAIGGTRHSLFLLDPEEAIVDADFAKKEAQARERGSVESKEMTERLSRSLSAASEGRSKPMRKAFNPSDFEGAKKAKY